MITEITWTFPLKISKKIKNIQIKKVYYPT